MQFQKVSRLEDLLTICGYNNPSNANARLIESNIISYLVYLKNREKVGFSTANGYLAAILLLTSTS